MRGKRRLSIRKKVFLLTASLSLALILVSVAVSSVIFNIRTKNNARVLCEDSAATLSEYLSDFEFQISTSSAMTNFLTYYIDKIDPIYQDSRAQIEEESAKDVSDEEDFAARKQFFTDLTSSVFGSGEGFGTSFETISFKNTYPDVVEEMDRMAGAIEGMTGCNLFYYDAENGNLVYLCDSTPTTSWAYCFPASVEKASGDFTENVYKKNAASVVSADGDFVAYAPVEVNGTTVAYVSFHYSIDRLVETENGFLWTLIGIMLAFTAVILFLYLVLSNRWLVKNVTKLSETARQFTSHMDEGEITPVDAKIGTNDEIGDLSDDFYALQSKVVSYSEDIAKKRAQEELMRAELGIATKIQMQSLPDRPLVAGDVIISSFIKPAKEVGGDLFDYFVTDNGDLFFVIADVSGKGIPAALFMMRGKEIIRSCARAGMSASKIAETANNELCKNNKEGLFITAFIGIYNDKTRRLSYARAGHEQPFLLRDGTAEKIGEESNYVLGAFSGVPFIEDSLEVRPDDRILFYTDGLNEGINEQNEEFGYDRIKAVMEKADGNLLAGLYESAVSFAGEAEQFDDITMLLFECVKSELYTVSTRSFDEIPALTGKINEFVKGYDSDKIAELDVIIDELVNNYISYAFEGVKKPQLLVEAKLSRGILQLTFSDNGILFDPLAKEDPDIDADLTERPAGGWGIMISKTISDRMSYCVFNGKNCLTVTKDLNPSGE
ncbi:MAG: SpoIIE family protein phosphatase [Clostridia bacterium]|nr:SpoIIE family protein phosphatase [Clostridia bacterium]